VPDVGCAGEARQHADGAEIKGQPGQSAGIEQGLAARPATSLVAGVGQQGEG
jgi:hypothetical protein